ncbi:MAG TPA: DNA polymerase III subunit alpha, partial [Spirochaetia bacterium]|nr:DNA polymerase III subunit alpha [Spirochaetia bacterium]
QEDEATKALLARGDSMGVFYVESPAMRQLQKKTGRGDFEHIVIHSSIIRPAANRYINEYVERLNGKPWAPLHPNLERILDETYGIMVYQEDVSKVAKALAGFSDAKADGLRKIMSKKDKGTRLDEYRKDFFDGSMRDGVGEDTVESIWNMILSFDGYSFCKPHSASYAMVSFQSAWLKAHFPAEFMAAVISNQGGYYTEGAYISEAKRMGLTILHPDVNESDYQYRGMGKNIRVGLMAIGGLRKETAEKIIEERRRKGRFFGIEDFCRRIRLLDEDAEALISVGTLDGISAGLNRPEQLMQVLSLVQHEKGGADQNQLFDACCSGISRRKDLSVYEKRKKEYQRLGFLCDTHPFYFWDEQVKKKGRILAKDIGSYIGKTIQVIGWLVSVKEVITIQGKPMEFVSFEDESAIFETVFFPESYKRFGPLLDERVPFIIKGLVDDDHGAISIHIDTMEKLKH